MSRSEHHPRFEMVICAFCRRTGPLEYVRFYDEYLCESCVENDIEARAQAWERVLGQEDK